MNEQMTCLPSTGQSPLLMRPSTRGAPTDSPREQRTLRTIIQLESEPHALAHIPSLIAQQFTAMGRPGSVFSCPRERVQTDRHASSTRVQPALLHLLSPDCQSQRQRSYCYCSSCKTIKKPHVTKRGGTKIRVTGASSHAF